MSVNGAVTTYTYDVFNRLRSSGGQSYTYGADGLRRSKGDTLFFWDGDNMVFEYGGRALNTYVYGINLVSQNDTTFYLYNAHGDVVQLANRDGVVSKNYEYDAFGNERNAAPNDTNPFRYSGEYFDSSSGTYYLRARYYDPRVGRFTSEDPIGSGLNWYTYCSNSPVMFVDPSGLEHIADAGAGDSIIRHTYWENGVELQVVQKWGWVYTVPTGRVGEDKANSPIGEVFGAIGNALSQVLMGAGVGASAVISGISDGFFPYVDANFIYNSSYTFGDFIYNQYSGQAAKMRMGYFDGSYNGCGWIATYNALLLLGISCQPSYIIWDYETRGGALVNGTLGVNPVAVNAFLRSQGVKSNIYNLPSSVDSRIKGSNASILAYAHGSGAHFVAIQYRDGQYYVYNDWSAGGTSNAPGQQSSIDAWLKEKNYSAISLVTLR